MKKKINFYMLLIAVICISTTMLLVSFVCYDLLKKQVMGDLKTYAYLLGSSGVPSETANLASNTEEGGLRVTIVDEGGSILYDSNADAGGMDNHRKRPEILQAFEKGEGQAIRKSSTLGKNAFYYAVLMKDGDVMRVSKEADSIWRVFAGTLPALPVAGVLLVLLCVVTVHFLTKSLIRPIEKLAHHVDNPEELNAYEELVPFILTIRKQHEDIMRNAGIRQEFTANVSHELKTPLTSISGYSELIENGMASEADIARFAREIHHNSNRLLTLINDVIRLSELDVADRDEPCENIDLSEIAETCVNMLQINAETHEVSLTFKGERSIVRSTRQMMEELVFNLCDNAIRYNVKGGKVDVTVRPWEGRTVLTVEDTGIGISEEHQERIFERFYRVDKSRSKSTGGTGLGLAIVKHIVAKNNAKITLRSRSGRGTGVKVVFPLVHSVGNFFT